MGAMGTAAAEEEGKAPVFASSGDFTVLAAAVEPPPPLRAILALAALPIGFAGFDEASAARRRSVALLISAARFSAK